MGTMTTLGNAKKQLVEEEKEENSCNVTINTHLASQDQVKNVNIFVREKSVILVLFCRQIAPTMVQYKLL